MTNGVSRSITAKAAANTRSAERASLDNGNVERGSDSKDGAPQWRRVRRYQKPPPNLHPTAPLGQIALSGQGGVVHGRQKVAADVHERSGYLLCRSLHGWQS